MQEEGLPEIPAQCQSCLGYFARDCLSWSRERNGKSEFFIAFLQCQYCKTHRRTRLY